jgi:hypothetical protein
MKYMKTLEFQSEVGADGHLRVEISANMPPGRVEGVVVLQSIGTASKPPYYLMDNAFAGQLSADLDIDAALDEMNRQWKDTLELPK